jgi:glutamyl-tRNA synthetase
VAVIALLARLGTSDPVEAVTDPKLLIDPFDFARFGRAPARFDEGELAALNQKIVHQLDYAAVQDRLPAGITAEGWAAIQPNIAHLGEVADIWQLVTGPIAAADLAEEDRVFAAQAAEILAALDWDAGIWAALTSALKDATGRKGKPLFMPLRRALTGRDSGPDMGALLPLIGREAALARLNAAAAGQ